MLRKKSVSLQGIFVQKKDIFWTHNPGKVEALAKIPTARLWTCIVQALR